MKHKYERVYVCWQRVYTHCARQLKRLDSVYRSPIYNYFSETLNGVTSIRAYGCEERFIQQNHRLIDQSQSVWYTVFTSNRWRHNVWYTVFTSKRWGKSVWHTFFTSNRWRHSVWCTVFKSNKWRSQCLGNCLHVKQVTSQYKLYIVFTLIRWRCTMQNNKLVVLIQHVIAS